MGIPKSDLLGVTMAVMYINVLVGINAWVNGKMLYYLFKNVNMTQL